MVHCGLGLCFFVLIWQGSALRGKLPEDDVPSDWRNALDQSVLSMPSIIEIPVHYDDDTELLPIAADHSAPAKNNSAPAKINSAPEYTGILTPGNLWPRTGDKTVVPYFISRDFETTQEAPIRVALQRIEHQTGNCITFSSMGANLAKTKKKGDYIQFVKNNQKKCYTFVGRRLKYNENQISLANNCLQGNESVGTVMHEVLHKLGFFHEHSRPDRSDFVRIHGQNIDIAHQLQFEKLPDMDTYGLQYDVESIMHYGAFQGALEIFAGAAEEHPTITPRSDDVRKLFMGQRARLSDGDIKKILLVYNCSSRDGLDDAVAAIRKNEVGQGASRPFTPGATFPVAEMTLDEWSRQEIANKCRFPVDPAFTENASMPMAMTISCNKNVTRADLQELVGRISEGPARPLAVVLPDSSEYMSRTIFNKVAKNVAIFILRGCITQTATGWPRRLFFNNLFRYHLSNCNELRILKTDFNDNKGFQLDYLRMISFSNTTILSLEDNAFEGLPRLVSVSLEHTANLMPEMAPRYARYLLRLHCSCAFSGFRRWLQSGNMAKVHKKRLGEIYSMTGSWINGPVTSRTLHLNYDCAKQAVEPAGENEDLETFSLNDDPCI